VLLLSSCCLYFSLLFKTGLSVLWLKQKKFIDIFTSYFVTFSHFFIISIEIQIYLTLMKFFKNIYFPPEGRKIFKNNFIIFAVCIHGRAPSGRRTTIGTRRPPRQQRHQRPSSPSAPSTTVRTLSTSRHPRTKSTRTSPAPSTRATRPRSKTR
jgi:hypothetical protein